MCLRIGSERMVRKNKKASKNRLLFFGSISFLCIFYFLSTLFNNFLSIKTLEEEQIVLENNLLTLKENEEFLKTEIVKLKDPEYLARYAREHYMYSMDGEYVIKIEGKEQEEEIEEEKEQQKAWIPFGFISLSSLSIVLFIKRVIW